MARTRVGDQSNPLVGTNECIRNPMSINYCSRVERNTTQRSSLVNESNEFFVDLPPAGEVLRFPRAARSLGLTGVPPGGAARFPFVPKAGSHLLSQ
jgi:hypothetical protein